MDTATKAVALQRIAAENIARAIEHRGESQSGVARRATGAHQTTIGRAAKAERNFRIGSLAAFADGLGYEPWQLLVPGFDPANPPKLVPPELLKFLK